MIMAFGILQSVSILAFMGVVIVCATIAYMRAGWSFADRLVTKFQLPVRSLREASPPAATDSPET